MMLDSETWAKQCRVRCENGTILTPSLVNCLPLFSLHGGLFRPVCDTPIPSLIFALSTGHEWTLFDCFHFPQQVGDHSVNLDYDGTNALYLPTATEASSPEDNLTAAVRSKYDEDIDADPTLPPVWSGDNLAARVSVEIAGDVTPTAVSVSCPLTPGGDTYGVGETIDLDVLFTTRVFVKDSVSKPHLLVETGEERRGEAKVGRKSRGVGEALPVYFYLLFAPVFGYPRPRAESSNHCRLL